MRELHFDYYMQIDYDQPIDRCSFTIKCIPKNNARQQVKEMNIELYPETKYSTGVDGLQNQQIYGYNEAPHQTFFFHLTGTAFTGLSEYEELENEDLDMVFAHPCGLNKAGEQIRGYFESFAQEHPLVMASCSNQKLENVPALSDELATNPQLDLAKELMHKFHQDFTYQSGVTSIQTSAEEAFTLGCGVCQDYAHIFIALLHLAKIPARYVTGLLIGEGASHAWVEVLVGGKWYGLDPTNDVIVDDQHIKIGVGRDARDCLINRGIMHGYAKQTQTIRVSVK